ncbi:MAG: DNA methyltransferase [Candidatus Nitrosopolaris sp.]
MRSDEVDDSWSFKELGRVQTSYLTHDYHRYPAKFIPQLTGRFIKENSRIGDLVCDPFMGSGTTLVEAIVNGRRAYGTDINPVAVLISKAKTTPIEPSLLKGQMSPLLGHIKADIGRKHHGQMPLLVRYDDLDITIPDNKRLEYWFPEKQKTDLAIILSRINTIEDQKVKAFLLCAFSNILKVCSRWMMKSVKPTIDKNKAIADAYKSFVLQTRRMMIKNEEFWKILGTNEFDCVVDNVHAYKMRLTDNSVTLIVTSPPYVTSYEYADLHQLTAIWLGYADKLSEFRSKFIGSIQKGNHLSVELYSKLGRKTVTELRQIDKREANGVEHYFFEMQLCFQEMQRVLKHDGRASIVIGDTELKKVRIHNTDVFIQTMEKFGFKVYDVIKRPIPSKNLPLTRDQKTGQFVATLKADRLAYPFEHILTMVKI